MGIGDSITLVSCLAGLMMALPGFLIFLNLVFARTTQRTANRLSKGAITPFFVGLVPVIVIGGPAVGMISLGSVFQLLGTLTILALVMWGFTGLAALARLLGIRLAEMGGHQDQPLVEMIVGAFVLSFALAFPLVGWFLLLPFGLIFGIGASVLSRFSRLSQLRIEATPLPPDEAPVYEEQTA